MHAIIKVATTIQQALSYKMVYRRIIYAIFGDLLYK